MDRILRIDIGLRTCRMIYVPWLLRARERHVVVYSRVSSRISRSVKVSTGKQGGRQTEPACSRTDSEKRVTDNAVPLQDTASRLHSGEDSKLMHTRQTAHLQPPPSGVYCRHLPCLSLSLALLAPRSPRPSLPSPLAPPFSRDPRNARSPPPFAHVASGCTGRFAWCMTYARLSPPSPRLQTVSWRGAKRIVRIFRTLWGLYTSSLFFSWRSLFPHIFVFLFFLYFRLFLASAVCCVPLRLSLLSHSARSIRVQTVCTVSHQDSLQSSAMRFGDGLRIKFKDGTRGVRDDFFFVRLKILNRGYFNVKNISINFFTFG